MRGRYHGKLTPFKKTILFGAITGLLYVFVFANSELVMSYFTKGSWYAALPVATVFIFSFAHGAFASSLWSVLGIGERRKALEPRPKIGRRRIRRRRPQPQLRLEA